jgi:hypothetical protein
VAGQRFRSASRRRTALATALACTSLLGTNLYHEREVVRFYDKKNANYATFMEPAYPGWRYGNANWTTNIHGTVRSGRACGSLRGNGKVLTTVCVPIP